MQYIKSPPPDRQTKTPKFKFPKGAWDTHFHIFGPQARFPLAPKRRLEVEDCTLDDLVSMHDALGITRGLIVQSFQHGYSYEYLLHALMRFPARFKACMIGAPDITDGELALLSKAGVVGARYAFKSSPRSMPPCKPGASSTALSRIICSTVRKRSKRGEIKFWPPRVALSSNTWATPM